MPFFVNPLKKHDASEYPNVLVPLHDAQRHASVVQANMLKSAESDPEKGDNDGRGGSEDQYSSYSIEGLKSEVEDSAIAGGHDSAYDKKSVVINKAIQDIGMGRYNWQLFVLCGFGWLADNLWLQGVALTLPGLSETFDVSETKVRYTTCATFAGLCVGASFWGIASDIIGRRLAFNTTLFLAGLFGLLVAAGQSWIAVCGLYAALGAGVGGNLPVDGALFLEFLPFASGGLLTMLSVWWPIGQLIASLVAWGFIGQAPNVYPHDKAWRYTTLTLGAITFLMFICRFFFFHLFESPKFLLSRGRQAESVAVVHGVAYKNKRKTWLTEDILNAVGGDPAIVDNQKLSTKDIVRRQLSKFSSERIGPLFATRQLALTTCLIWFCWTTIGMGYPLFNAFLPQYLAQPGKGQPTPSNATIYRNYAITSIVGVPGSIIACYTVDIKYIGRKGTMATATLLSGIMLFLFTISPDSNYQLAFTCVEAFFQNIMYGVLYA
ncbi:MAG: hypothetical protein M1814_005000 [Vezdaea aestivalis]|nr:MAG: hypothetical protein M1814_005000 [Vezdaea aestivalis]